MGDQSRVFVRKLLIWYKKAARCLPWRDTRNPYAILVSEFHAAANASQSSARVLPRRFMARFPTIDKLARARPKAVMEQWEGLGYYARARNLHALARVVSKTHHGMACRITPRVARVAGCRTVTRQARWHASRMRNRCRQSIRTFVESELESLGMRKSGNAKCGIVGARLGDSPLSTASAHGDSIRDDGARRAAGLVRRGKPKCPQCPVNRHCAAVRSGTRIRNQRLAHPE